MKEGTPPQEHIDWLHLHGFSQEEKSIWWNENLRVQLCFRLYPSRWQSIFFKDDDDTIFESGCDTPSKSVMKLVEKISDEMGVLDNKLKYLNKKAREIVLELNKRKEA